MKAIQNTNFIEKIIKNDLKNGKYVKIITRFPPEPNGYLHIGHAKSIYLNFLLAQKYNSQCFLRFDDTNPSNEYKIFMNAIIKDIKWLGFECINIKYTSEYFDKFYILAKSLIKKGLAYVCSLTPEEVKEYRGTLTKPGKPSPNRNRKILENLDLFRRMKSGEFAEKKYSLRAKIDMSANNINLRDPIIYRIRNIKHPRTGNKWCIYPMYDFSHPLSDSIENISHSLCTLEFEDHKPLYNWFIKNCDLKFKPQQIEFSRLNIDYTLTSKRKLKNIVNKKIVSGWDDPRISTFIALRRRGCPPKAIRRLYEQVGISKQDNTIISSSLFDNTIRYELNKVAPRRMAVINPLKIIIINYEKIEETISIPNHPKNPKFGMRNILFTKELYIERSDFQIKNDENFYGLSIGNLVRLMYAYIIECVKIIHNVNGEISELYCKYFPETMKKKNIKNKEKPTIFLHWVSAKYAILGKINFYDQLFNIKNPNSCKDIISSLNPNSLKVIKNAKLEPSLNYAVPESIYQFYRIGYFCADIHHHKPEKKIVFNQTVSLKNRYIKNLFANIKNL